MHSIEQESVIPHSNFRVPPRSIPQPKEQEKQNNLVQDHALAFTIGAFAAGIGIGIVLAATRREDLDRLAEHLHSGYDRALDHAGRARNYVKGHAQDLPSELSRIGNKIKFW